LVLETESHLLFLEFLFEFILHGVYFFFGLVELRSDFKADFCHVNLLVVHTIYAATVSTELASK